MCEVYIYRNLFLWISETIFVIEIVPYNSLAIQIRYSVNMLLRLIGESLSLDLASYWKTRSLKNFRNVSAFHDDGTRIKIRAGLTRLRAARAGDIKNCKLHGCAVSSVLLVSRHSITSRCFLLETVCLIRASQDFQLDWAFPASPPEFYKLFTDLSLNVLSMRHENTIL